MANRNKDLSRLFKEYILRSAKEKSTSYSGSNNGYGYSPLGCRGRFNGGMALGNGINHSIGIVYFYEWSDSSNLPKTFFTIDAFSKFLLSVCGITLQGYEREIIEAVHVAYISCKHGSKQLIIKKDFKALNEELAKSKPKVAAPIGAPKIINMQWFG